MPRAARKKSSTGIYHIVLRGINKQQIFEDDEVFTIKELKRDSCPSCRSKD
jgi:REP element-mobilizing transposase RayT